MGEAGESHDGMPAQKLGYASTQTTKDDWRRRKKVLGIVVGSMGLIASFGYWLVRWMQFDDRLVFPMMSCLIIVPALANSMFIQRRRLRILFISIMATLLVVAVLLNGSIQSARFMLSRSSFEEAVDGERPLVGGTFGLYHVDSVQTDTAGHIWFRTENVVTPAGNINRGFVYSPPGSTPTFQSPFNASPVSSRTLGKGWSEFEADDAWR
ncbi:MAG: hypothetical protein AAF743_01515 [Planctomycetota bacterium]